MDYLRLASGSAVSIDELKEAWLTIESGEFKLRARAVRMTKAPMAATEGGLREVLSAEPYEVLVERFPRDQEGAAIRALVALHDAIRHRRVVDTMWTFNVDGDLVKEA